MTGVLLLTLFATYLPAMSVVYERYPSGRPRLVVKATRDPDELLLLRYADAPRAQPRVIDRQALDSRPDEVLLEKVIDPKDVVVTMAARHGAYSIVDRVTDNRLVRIADGFREAIDLDRDGVPEIIDIGFGGQNECGVYSYVALMRWNGKRYVEDGRRYVATLSPDYASDEVLLSESKHYAVRLFGRGRVLIDGNPIPPGVPFEFSEICHTIDLQAAGPKTRAFLEELP